MNDNADQVLRQVLSRLDSIMRENLLLRETVASLIADKTAPRKKVELLTREQLKGKTKGRRR